MNMRRNVRKAEVVASGGWELGVETKKGEAGTFLTVNMRKKHNGMARILAFGSVAWVSVPACHSQL